MFKIFGQLFRLPLAIFAFSAEKFSETVRGLERMLGESFEEVSGGAALPRGSPAAASGHPAPADAGTTENKGAAGDGTPMPKEEKRMADTNLNDEMAKLVQYTIVSLDRDKKEKVLYGPEQVVETKNLTGDAFSNAKIADWVKDNKWDGDGGDLRVYYTVLERWPREDLDYERKQLDRLKNIESAIRETRGAAATTGGAKKR